MYNGLYQQSVCNHFNKEPDDNEWLSMNQWEPYWKLYDMYISVITKLLWSSVCCNIYTVYAIIHTVHKVCNDGAGIYSSVMVIKCYKPT